VIKEFVQSRLVTDEISDVLGSRDYAMRYFFKDLSVEILGARSKDHVTVSRYYLTLNPKVVVDFEPHPLDGAFHVEQKRRYFLDKRIVYVAIFLKDRLTDAQFAERVEEAREFTKRGVWEQRQQLELDEVHVEGIELTPATELWINREVHARFLKHKAQHVRPHLLKGFIELKVKERIKKELILELARQKKRSHGRLDTIVSASDIAVTTR
jgi:hypothetical protein